MNNPKNFNELLQVYAEAYFQTRKTRLNINPTNYKEVLVSSFDYLFIKGLILEIEENLENYEGLADEIIIELNSIIEKNKKNCTKKVSLTEQIKSEGYSFDFSDFEPLPNSILFS